MDETYIKMCRTAQEIQELWEPKLGDRYCYYNTPSSYVIELVCDEINGRGIDSDGDYLDKDVNAIFLPHQEDLQEIIENNHKLGIRGPWLLTRAFLRFVEKLIPERLIKIDMNTAWLLFVMETCFGKQWDTAEERWVEL